MSSHNLHWKVCVLVTSAVVLDSSICVTLFAYVVYLTSSKGIGCFLLKRVFQSLNLRGTLIFLQNSEKNSLINKKILIMVLFEGLCKNNLGFYNRQLVTLTMRLA